MLKKKLVRIILVLLSLFAICYFLKSSPKIYFFVNKNKLQLLANEIIKYQKITSLEMGNEESYLNDEKVILHDYYRFLNGDLITHYGKTDRVTNPL